MISRERWGKAPDGKEIFLYTLRNSSGASVQLADIGAAIVSIVVPDKHGTMGDVVLGYRNASDYFGDGPCAGKIPGRFANRIAGGRFTLDGKNYQLPLNDGSNHLHSGPNGFQNQVWESHIEGETVVFTYLSKDGEAGYPGNLMVTASYEWSEGNELRLTLSATTDAPTVVNLTNHAYFNLDGEDSGSVLNHLLEINSSHWLPMDAGFIPTGEIASAEGTPMDFSRRKAIGKDMSADFKALREGKGYNACYLIDRPDGYGLVPAATLWAVRSGRRLDILTTQPSLMLYTGSWLKGCPAGKTGRLYEDYDAVALECQHTPDAPNQKDFPSTVLRPGEVLNEMIVWRFSVERNQ
ncbi:MAG: galactose mutarotase [Bacteroidales bacterium]|nr:galactose mutarotase [Bacteroidales bacterium]